MPLRPGSLFGNMSRVGGAVKSSFQVSTVTTVESLKLFHSSLSIAALMIGAWRRAWRGRSSAQGRSLRRTEQRPGRGGEGGRRQGSVWRWCAEGREGGGGRGRSGGQRGEGRSGRRGQDVAPLWVTTLVRQSVDRRGRVVVDWVARSGAGLGAGEGNAPSL